MATTSVGGSSVAMDDPDNESEIKAFMEKYEQVDKDRKKYMICFFALFALVIIFLVIILVGLTANNRSSPSNIDTCHTDCASSSNNDFVTLTETDTDIPIATYQGWLDVYLQNRNLTNYTRILSNNGTIIDDLDTYLYEIKQNLGLENGDEDVYLSIIYQEFQGNVEYDYLLKGCNILYTG